MDLTVTTPIRQQRQQLRQSLRHARRQLSPRDQQQASQQLKKLLWQQLWFLRAKHLACYLASDGELALTKEHFQPHQQLYLPCLPVLPAEPMALAPWHAQQPLIPNRYGIGEPACWRAQAVSPWTLDVILLPLVGFDRQGNRLGMGGGFYDRLLAQLKPWQRRPLLVGIGHRLQELEAVPTAPWDEPLDWVLTPQEAIDCRKVRHVTAATAGNFANPHF